MGLPVDAEWWPRLKRIFSRELNLVGVPNSQLAKCLSTVNDAKSVRRNSRRLSQKEGKLYHLYVLIKLKFKGTV
jgi:hypothetical protein